MDNEEPGALIRLLLARLERISADSHWAHRASGVRGALLRALESMEKGKPFPDENFSSLIELGFTILAQAAAGNQRRRQTPKQKWNR